MIFVRDEDIRIMGQRGEFRGEYSIGVTAGELKDKHCTLIWYSIGTVLEQYWCHSW